MGVSSRRDKTRGPGEPVAVKIKLGWLLSGPLKLERKSFNSHEDYNGNFLPQVRRCQGMLSVEENVNKQWDLDTIGIRQEDEAHKGFIDDIMFTGTRYSVALPWEVGNDTLPPNYSNFLMRLQGQIRKF